MDRNPGAPIEADLRRGVSTAYYALFPLLVHEATTQLVAIAALRPRVARSFDHRVMRTVCQDYNNAPPNAAGVLVTAAGQVVPPQIQEIASHFIELQKMRNQADYDTGIGLTHAEADIAVLRAEAAFLDWQAIHTDPASSTFLAELLCRGLPKR